MCRSGRIPPKWEVLSPTDRTTRTCGGAPVTTSTDSALGDVPAKTPGAIVDKLNKEINAALTDPKMKARLADLGGMILAGSPADFRSLIAKETEKWGKLIRAANIRPE